MIRCGAGLELEPGVELETLSIGHPENSLADGYEMETAGAFLSYTIAIRGTEVHVFAALIDSISAPEFLLRIPDSEDGWRVAFAFISSLERYQVQDLTKPIQVGDPTIHDPHTCWIVA